MTKKKSTNGAAKTSKATSSAKPKASKAKSAATNEAAKPVEEVGTEVKIITVSGDVSADGEMISLNGREVNFKGGGKYSLTKNELLVRACQLSEVKVGDQMVLVEAFGCGGYAIEIGECGGVMSKNTVCIKSKRSGGFVERDVSGFSGTYLIIPVKALGTDIKVVSARGNLKADGDMTKIEDRVVEFADGNRLQLEEGDMVLEACELTAITESQKVLLVEQWGCGGQFMQCGYVGRILSQSVICFKKAPEHEYEETTIGRLSGGTYKVIA